jgi:hypothetical protein
MTTLGENGGFFVMGLGWRKTRKKYEWYGRMRKHWRIHCS